MQRQREHSRRASLAQHFTIHHEYHRAAGNVQANAQHHCVGNHIRNSKSREMTSHHSSKTLRKDEVPGCNLVTMRFARSMIEDIAKYQGGDRATHCKRQVRSPLRASRRPDANITQRHASLNVTRRLMVFRRMICWPVRTVGRQRRSSASVDQIRTSAERSFEFLWGSGSKCTLRRADRRGLTLSGIVCSRAGAVSWDAYTLELSGTWLAGQALFGQTRSDACQLAARE